MTTITNMIFGMIILTGLFVLILTGALSYLVRGVL
jgi:hypothetical protein